jgi:stearoyl-CoA desaturase (delta-9 desaturase)
MHTRFPAPKLDWTNIAFISFAHLMAVVAILYVVAVHFSWWTLALGVVWFALCGVGITGGYHRLFAHPTYKASRWLRAFYLFFGAASIQNSALKWSADHRVHHSRTDKDEDPYNISRGFFWAHIGWVFYQDQDEIALHTVRDLAADPLVRFQDEHYVLVAFLAGALLPVALGSAWGDPIGALLVAGFLRLVVQWHATFAVNSFAHMIGTQPFSTKNSARDSFWTALITLGEGYHNFHHKFQLDYRNGFRWYHLDPTKWFVWTMSKVGATWDLRRTRDEVVRSARQAVLAEAALPRG